MIYALDRDTAAIAVVDSNLHREHILPSEKAFAYRMKLEAMSRQGHRSDLTSDQLGRKLETAEIIAQQSDDSKSQVRRYIRLTYLIPELLEKMDQGEIALSVGVSFRFLTSKISGRFWSNAPSTAAPRPIRRLGGCTRLIGKGH